MKEQFVNISTLIDQTKLLSDMELQSYLASLDQSQKTDFIGSNVNETIKAVNKQKSDKFTDLMDQVTGSDNSITSAAHYLYRTADLKNLASEVDNMTVKQLNTIDINKDLSARQYEINEWSNSNKLDTLYFLQVLFISLSLFGVLIFLMSSGFISASLLQILGYSIAVVAILMLVIRWRYTRYSRDGRYWNKLQFPKIKSSNKQTECGAAQDELVVKPVPKQKKKVCTYVDA